MSRTIKFRVWDKEKSRWGREYDEQLEDQEDSAYEKEYGEDSGWLDGDVASDLDLVNGRLAIERYVWEQFTGLKDENGKEIYEGDIVRYSFINPNRTYTELVSFGPIQDGEGYYHQEFLAWRTTYADNGIAHSSLLDLVEPNWTCEIIGNIHENGELLDKSNQV